MTKTKKLIIIFSVIAIAITLLVVGTIFDLQISKLLASLPTGKYYSSNIFAIAGEWFGEDILYLFLISSCAILFFYLLKFPLKQKYLTITSQVVLCGTSYLIAFYSFHKTLKYIATYLSSLSKTAFSNYLSSALGIITVAITSAIICVLIFLLISRLKPETLQALWKWAIVVLVSAVISNAIVQVSKHIFDRTRYRAMIFVGDTEFTHFTNWFNINSNKFNSTSLFAEDFFKSFPSGHTCAATSIFLLTLLPSYIKKVNTKSSKIIFWSTSIVYTIFVALSRIVAGAHFFTDVYVSFLITITTIFVTYILVNLILKKLKTKFETNATTDVGKSNEITVETSSNTSAGNEKSISKNKKTDTKEK